jgi:hypothetical protein
MTGLFGVERRIIKRVLPAQITLVVMFRQGSI